jgi:hypothetical protein
MTIRVLELHQRDSEGIAYHSKRELTGLRIAFASENVLQAPLGAFFGFASIAAIHAFLDSSRVE